VDLPDQERAVLAAVSSSVDLTGGPLDLPFSVVARWLGLDESKESEKIALDLLRSLIRKQFIKAEIGWDGIYAVTPQINGNTATERNSKRRLGGNALNEESVFVVHGHDLQLREAVARFVERIGFNAIILSERTSSGRTIIEQVEHYANVGYAIVLLTPDDVSYKAGEITDSDGRARQNVIFELGFFVGRLGRSRVHCLRRGSVELFSDLYGVIWTPVDDPGVDWRIRVAREMSDAGFAVDLNKAFNT
jgi:predicted nucleotide-binding protein